MKLKRFIILGVVPFTVHLSAMQVAASTGIIEPAAHSVQVDENQIAAIHVQQDVAHDRNRELLIQCIEEWKLRSGDSFHRKTIRAIEKLLEEGAAFEKVNIHEDLYKECDSLLEHASMFDSASVVRALLKAGAVPKNEDLLTAPNPLYWAVVNKNEEIAELLLDAGADPLCGPKKDYPLYYALKNEYYSLVLLMLHYL